tara:strand:- start:624 stop:1049 length:426 start_codon:yes stop_codon:yes gene_type:complete
MQSLALKIFPFYFLFLILLVYLSLKKSPSIKKESNKIHDTNYFLDFVKDAEKKLIALKEMYDQNLITPQTYISKTELVALLVKRNVDISMVEKSIQTSNRDKYSEIRNSLNKKIIREEKEILKKSNLDSLILAVDKKIEKR